jgi:hypothetical protein
VHDGGVVLAGKYVAGAAHIGCQLKNLVEAAVDCQIAHFWTPQITKKEIVCVGFRVLGELEVDATDP